MLVKFYPRELGRGAFTLPNDEEGQDISRPLLIKTLVLAAGLLVAFLGGAPIALSSFIAANLLLITRRRQPHVVFAEFDWSLLVFFASLFVVSGSLETSGVTRDLIQVNFLAQQVNIGSLTAITAVLSNLVSNVPAVLLLRPLVAGLPDPHTGWLTIAAASTLAGNLTLLGSVANLIVAETASRWRVDLSFWEYTRPGLIITLITLATAVLWLSVII